MLKAIPMILSCRFRACLLSWQVQALTYLISHGRFKSGQALGNMLLINALLALQAS